jgi:hypothetical protein
MEGDHVLARLRVLLEVAKNRTINSFMQFLAGLEVRNELLRHWHRSSLGHEVVASTLRGEMKL